MGNKIKKLLRKPCYAILDLYHSLFKRNSMIPPRSMVFIGGGDFKKIGEEFKNHFITIGNCKPDFHILDVGCGIGRMAVPLTEYLSKGGEYHGIDIVEKGIVWCKKRISTKFPNFHFLHSDIYNKMYNPKGKHKASEYTFPFEDEKFDFIFLTSVFTHMFPADLENYLKEISRVLKKNGRCMISYFLQNEESQEYMNQGKSTQDFKYEVEGCLTTDREVPELALLYKEDYIRELYQKYGLKISEPMQYGSWCGREKYLSYQDIIVAEKG